MKIKPWNVDETLESFAVSSGHRRCKVFSFICIIKTLFDTTRLLSRALLSNLNISFINKQEIGQEILLPWIYTFQKNMFDIDISC